MWPFHRHEYKMASSQVAKASNFWLEGNYYRHSDLTIVTSQCATCGKLKQEKLLGDIDMSKD